MAPIRKKSISAVFPKWCSNVCSSKTILFSKPKEEIFINSEDWGSSQEVIPLIPKEILAQQIPIINKAGISLLIFMVCSIEIAIYPKTKTIIKKSSMALKLVFLKNINAFLAIFV